MIGRILCLLVLLCATGARAEEDATPAPAPPAPKAARPKLTLDRLLRVPTTTVQSSEIRGGRDRKAWQEEFSRLRREIFGVLRAVSSLPDCCWSVLWRFVMWFSAVPVFDSYSSIVQH